MDARLSAVYMCVLADHVAHRNSLRPITDQVDAHAAVGGWNAERVASALIGQPDTEARVGGDTTARVAMMALELVVPDDLESVPMSRVIEIREAHADLLGEFRVAVGDAVRTLSELPPNVDQKVLEQYVTDEVQRAFAIPKRELEKALRGLRVPTTQAVLGTKLELPALLASSGVANLDPIITSSVGLGLGIFNIRAERTARRAEALRASPAAAYLLHVGRDLGPSGMLSRARAAFGRRLR